MSFTIDNIQNNFHFKQLVRSLDKLSEVYTIQYIEFAVTWAYEKLESKLLGEDIGVETSDDESLGHDDDNAPIIEICPECKEKDADAKNKMKNTK